MPEHYVLPNVSPVCAGFDNVNAYELELVLESAGNSKWILIPADVELIVVTLSFTGGGRGKIQTTTDINERVITNDGVIAVDWDLGTVNDAIQDSVPAVTALRVVHSSSTGTVKMTMRAH